MRRILSIEPDPTTANMLLTMLGHAGYRVYSTCDGEEAIAEFRTYHYDLIITEFDLRVIRLTRPTPLIVLSLIDTVEAKIQAFGHGADDYLAKPFHREELLARIRARL